MINRPLNSYRPIDAGSSDWELDQRPGLRLAGLGILFILSVLAIAARLVFVQTRLGEDYAAEFEKTIERREPIATRDGRIISADGQVLAEDVELFALKVHYRWLEDPVDSDWLRRQALSRLDRSSRRDRKRVQAEEVQVLKRRDELWRRLASLAGCDKKAMDRERHRIQQRVARVFELVENRRGQAQDPSAIDNSGETSTEQPRGWGRAWRAVVAAVTTPPRREVEEPLVIREQLDYHVLLPEIPQETAVEIEANPERYPGTRVESRTRRIYPQGSAAAHLVGHRTALDDEAIRARHQSLPQGDPLDYQAGDRQGQTGLERQYERHLRGLRGERKVVFNRRGELIANDVVREPRYGHDVVLSLNLSLQQAAEQLLDEQLAGGHIDESTGKPLPTPPGGAIVAIDVRTGDVLAAASAPRFDPALLSDGSAAQWGQVTGDPRKPLFHRATTMTLPPGSVFKVVSAVAFLESGRLDPERMFACQGYLDNPDRYRCFTFRNFGVGHGDVDLVAALARSCNVYFFAAARRIGSAPLQTWATRFGLGQSTGIDLPGEAAGHVPNTVGDDGRTLRTKPARGVSGDALQMAIGQGKVTATPLQIARLMAAIANGGRLVTPRLASSAGGVGRSSGETEGSSPVAESPMIPELSKRSIEWVRQGLQQVVSHPQGTGYKTVRLKDVLIAGKTGTAESGGGRPDHAWFAGYVPADRPRIAFVVVLEHAGPGGHAAGPVARELVQAAQALGMLSGPRVDAPSAN